jgi:peptide deformylase
VSGPRVGDPREAVLRLVDLAAQDPRGVVPIVRAGDPVLRAAAAPYDGQLADGELASLLALMHRTLRAAPGVGLAAPQIGLPLALAVIEDPLADASRERLPVPFRVLVNPRYEALDDELVAHEEGCLSVPGYAAVVARHRRVHLVGHDERGVALDEELVGWPARIVQHETDHLGGTLYVDKADLRTLTAVG